MAEPESLIDTLSLEAIEVNLFRGRDKDGRGRIFGGLVIAQALMALGYNEREAQAALKALPADVSVSDGIRQALKSLSKA